MKKGKNNICVCSKCTSALNCIFISQIVCCITLLAHVWRNFCNIECSFWNCKVIFYFFCLLFSLSFSPIQYLLPNSDITWHWQHLGLQFFKIRKWTTAWRCTNLRFLNFMLLLASIGYFVDFSFASLIKTGFSSWCCCHWICYLFPLLQKNLLCMRHFERTKYNSGKIDRTGNIPSEKNAGCNPSGCITWPPYAFCCRFN